MEYKEALLSVRVNAKLYKYCIFNSVLKSVFRGSEVYNSFVASRRVA